MFESIITVSADLIGTSCACLEVGGGWRGGYTAGVVRYTGLMFGSFINNAFLRPACEEG